MDWGALFALTIGGVDRTADVVGAGYVDRELDASGIAQVYLRGTMPAVGAAVVISGVVDVDYVGVVDRVQFDPATDKRCWKVDCTDNLQGYFEALGAASIAAGNPLQDGVLAVLPAGAYWHEGLFSDATDGWEVCQDAMSCVPASIWLEGGVLQSASWAGNPDLVTIAHDEGSIYDGSLTLDIAGVRDLTGKVVMSAEIRYTRLHQWRHDFAWSGPRSPTDPTEPLSFCENYNHPITWPTRDMISSVVASNSWGLLSSGGLLGGTDKGISYTGLWPSGTYDTPEVDCGPVIWALGEGADQFVYSAHWSVGRRWAQTITEKYILTVTGTGAAGDPENDEMSHEYTDEGGSWDSSTPALPLPAFAQSSAGWQSSGTVHSWVDLIDTADRDDLLEAAVALCATRIRATQRQSTMRVEILPASEPALGSWLTIEALDVTGKGQVGRLLTNWDFDSHQAGCQLTLILSEGTLAGDDLAAPTPPDVTPTAAGYSLSGSTSLPTYIGGITDCPAQDDDWVGYVGNRQVPDSGAETYSAGFSIETPDVPDEARDEQTETTEAAYSIDPLDGGLTFP